MEGTHEVHTNILDWVASISAQGDVFHHNIYWIYGLPGIGKTLLAHLICAGPHKKDQLASCSLFRPQRGSGMLEKHLYTCISTSEHMCRRK